VIVEERMSENGRVLDISEYAVELITCRSRWLCYKLDDVVVSDEILNVRKGELGNMRVHYE
jgi:hypothetical protein